MKLYKHYRGGLYIKITEGINTETKERQVVYQSVQTGKIWIRNAEIFHGNTTFKKRFVEVEG